MVCAFTVSFNSNGTRKFNANYNTVFVFLYIMYCINIMGMHCGEFSPIRWYFETIYLHQL